MNYDNIIVFFILSILEIILGIDNLIFISLISNSASAQLRNYIKLLGLGIALTIRILILIQISKVKLLDNYIIIPLLSLSVKDLLMIFGGAFLIYNSFSQILYYITTKKKVNPLSIKIKSLPIILQIILVDLVFSIDSIFAALAMTENIPIITAAFVISTIFMFISSKAVSNILEKYNKISITAISFILLIGIVILCEGFHIKINKNYIYSAFLFSLLIEFIHILKRKAGN